MGFFGQLFGKKEEPACEPLTVYAPAQGKVIPVTEFPDEVFSQEILGKGCGIEPSGDTLYAPFNGKVTTTTDTLHAVGVTSDDGVEVLMHIGVDTVDMNGKGFTYLIKDGQRVLKGDKLITFDKAVIAAANHKDTIAVVVTNSDDFSDVSVLTTGDVETGTAVLKAAK